LLEDFCAAIDRVERNGDSNLCLDFTSVVNAYPNGMVPIIATVENLRHKGISFKVLLPNHFNTRKMFRSVNWAYLLSPSDFDASEAHHDRHLVTRRFTDAAEQKSVVDDFMDVVLRNISAPRPIFSGLEWSVNEITDNVLNHSNSIFGGLIQANIYLKNNTVAFAVADAGRGILASLSEGIPSLRTDSQAIGEAIKAEVTRGAKFGQGNGLAGAVRVTTLSGGSFELTSGKSRLLVTPTESKNSDRRPFQYFQGTAVAGQIRISEDFSIEEALSFGNRSYAPVDFIELNSEQDDDKSLKIELKAESTGYGTRQAGKQLRTKAINLLRAEKTHPLVIDWAGIPVISSSFADEFLGKLFLELGPLTFSSRVRNIGMEQLIAGLLDKAISQRLTQAED
jgi:hypothetical protein